MLMVMWRWVLYEKDLVFMFDIFVFFFFFQAEDGIRDHCVTGVQTCALPICLFEIHRQTFEAEKSSIVLTEANQTTIIISSLENDTFQCRKVF